MNDEDNKNLDFDKCDFYYDKYNWKTIADWGYLSGDCEVCGYYDKCKEKGYLKDKFHI